jgi:biotin transport system substrate-specific component
MNRLALEVDRRHNGSGSALVRHLRLGLAMVGFALLTGIGARIAVPLPFTPVPGTLQTLPALLAGLFLGARAGAVSQVLYVTMGLAGLPVFALPGAGPAYLLGPTAGYLVGLAAGAGVTGLVYRGVCRWGAAGRFLSLLAGSAVLYLCGLSWLAVYLGGDVAAAFRAGAAPFLLFALAKIVIAAAIHSGAISLGGLMHRRWTSAI